MDVLVRGIAPRATDRLGRRRPPETTHIFAVLRLSGACRHLRPRSSPPSSAAATWSSARSSCSGICGRKAALRSRTPWVGPARYMAQNLRVIRLSTGPALLNSGGQKKFLPTCPLLEPGQQRGRRQQHGKWHRAYGEAIAHTWGSNSISWGVRSDEIAPRLADAWGHVCSGGASSGELVGGVGKAGPKSEGGARPNLPGIHLTELGLGCTSVQRHQLTQRGRLTGSQAGPCHSAPPSWWHRENPSSRKAILGKVGTPTPQHLVPRLSTPLIYPRSVLRPRSDHSWPVLGPHTIRSHSIHGACSARAPLTLGSASVPSRSSSWSIRGSRSTLGPLSAQSPPIVGPMSVHAWSTSVPPGPSSAQSRPVAQPLFRPARRIEVEVALGDAGRI